MKLLMEEEDARAKEEHEKQVQAAKVIAKHWRKYKARKLTEFTQITRSLSLKNFNKTIGVRSRALLIIQVVYLPQLKKCFICKTANAQRQCPMCDTALYCENCFTEYHQRGHRKRHNYKRIRYGQQPADFQDNQDNPLKTATSLGEISFG